MTQAHEHILLHPEGAHALLVLSHGSGAGMRHPFMEGLAQALARHGVATWRFEFPYMRAGKSFPDRPPILVEAVRSQVRTAVLAAGGLPVFAGGKSLGGRMTSTAVAEGGLPEVRGLVFFGFPLHPAARPGTARAEHLSSVQLPMLFLQGDRDRLAHLELLEPLLQRVGGHALLHRVRDADHGFHVRKSSGRDDGQVLEELGRVTADWMSGVLKG